jgi:hypothetical protein
MRLGEENMSDEDAGYILTEIWNAKPSWLALSPDERRRFFDEKVHPFIGKMLEGGAEIIGCAINDNSRTERIAYRYMAVWKLPGKAFSEKLETGAKELGFLDYFDQVNFSGSVIPPPIMNDDMISLKS